MKKLMLLILSVSLATFVGGCSLFVKEVDYQTIANDLNEKNMENILNAVEGYAEINQYITISDNGTEAVDNNINDFLIQKMRSLMEFLASGM